ncbi:MAG: ABC transporter permease [Planctomycetes bacterium]|nr:ABC transporter permease [Planctomycetota bacterium]
MVIWTLAKKDLRLLLRDPRALIILLAMPLIFILVLGMSLGDNFGKSPGSGLRVTVLNLDEGIPRQKWADLLIRDLNETADIRVEFIDSREEADRLVRTGKRAAVLIVGKNFSKRLERCSFLAPDWLLHLAIVSSMSQPGDFVTPALCGCFDEKQSALPLYLVDGLNPYYREGVDLKLLDIEVLRDPTQQTAAAIIDQVAQGSLLRVVMPWMIGRAFDKLGERDFLDLLATQKETPELISTYLTVLASDKNKKELSVGLQKSLQKIFKRYDLTAKTWAALTRQDEILTNKSGANMTYAEDGIGLLRRGGSRYQLLVPSYLVMFAFFLVLTLGWLFVAEKRQGTLKRLMIAPITTAEILIGKMLPCLAISLFQGFFLLGAGRLIFDMNWGAAPLWLIPLVVATSLAAIGLAVLVAAIARTETQVAIYGTLLVLVLAGLSGCLMGDRAMMPEQMQQFSRITPHAWALDAYRQLLTNPQPEMQIVIEACAILTSFGVGFTALAWLCLNVDADG